MIEQKAILKTLRIFKKLFSEIKGKIKLDDTSLKFKDRKFYYWPKTEKKVITAKEYDN